MDRMDANRLSVDLSIRLEWRQRPIVRGRENYCRDARVLDRKRAAAALGGYRLPPTDCDQEFIERCIRD